MLVDPSLIEEEVCDGRVCTALNTHHEICMIRKMGAAAISPTQAREERARERERKEGGKKA